MLDAMLPLLPGYIRQRDMPLYVAVGVSGGHLPGRPHDHGCQRVSWTKIKNRPLHVQAVQVRHFHREWSCAVSRVSIMLCCLHIWSYLIIFDHSSLPRKLVTEKSGEAIQISTPPAIQGSPGRDPHMRLVWGAHVGMYTELATMYAKCAADLRFIQVSCWEDNTKIQGPKQLRTQDKSLKVQVQVRVSWPRMAHPQSLQVQAKDADGLHQDERAEVEHPKAHPCMREATSSWHSNHMFWMSLDIIYIITI